MTKYLTPETDKPLVFPMEHYGKTPEEQIEKNKPAIALLKKWLEEADSEQILDEEKIRREEAWKLFQHFINSDRLSGRKLFTKASDM